MAIRQGRGGRAGVEGAPISVKRPVVEVAAAVLLRPNGDVLLAQRPPGKPYAGYWEFPGGKFEPGETPRAALDRELQEELGITVCRASPWLLQDFVYPHAHVELHFFRVYEWDGELVGHDGQAFAWQQPGRYTVAPLLPANTAVLSALSLPAVYGITNAADSDEATFLAHAERALAGGLRLIQVRDREWPLERRIDFAAILAQRARAHGARVLFNGSADEARRAQCAGVHWTAATLATAGARPDDLLVASSCHTREDVELASGLRLDFAVLGPVAATPTHPRAVPLGWDGFAERVARTRIPIFALGGMTAAHLEVAIGHGGHGIASRRDAWVAP
jgi:8-oxo-dGTP diphosphatase